MLNQSNKRIKHHKKNTGSEASPAEHREKEYRLAGRERDSGQIGRRVSVPGQDKGLWVLLLTQNREREGMEKVIHGNRDAEQTNRMGRWPLRQ